MIIEIALGIVLAVIVLAILPYVIAMGVVVVRVVMPLIIVGAVLLFFLWNLDALIAVAVMAGSFIVLWYAARLINRRWEYLEKDIIIAGFGVALLWGGTVFAIVMNINEVCDAPLDLVPLLLLDVGGGYFLIRQNKKLFAEWQRKKAITESYGNHRATGAKE